METENNESKRSYILTPPYISYMTFINFLDWLKEMPVIPTQIDRSLWKDKFSGSTGIQLMSALRFLKLLDDNKPQSRLAELVKADKDKRKSLIKEILCNAYGPEIVDELISKTPQMLENKLKALGTTDTTHRKAISFFINAAKSNDIVVPTAISKKARIRMSGQRGQRSSSLRTKEKHNGTEKPSDSKKTNIESQFLLHSAITALLKDLEKSGPSWTKSERDRWFKTFEANLNYAYPPKKDGDTEV